MSFSRVWPTLYKRAVIKDKISTWYVETNKDKFRTVSGYLDGEKVISAWTTCVPKNTGKKNSTTPSEQAIAEADAMWEKKKATGYWENIENIDESVYFQPMLAKDYEKTKEKLKYCLYSDPKLDGIRCITRIDGMWSRNGKKIISAPHIFKALEPLFELYPDLILDGELYADKNVTDFNTIVSCVRKTKPTQEDLDISKKFIQYHLYDVPSYNGLFSQRKSHLNGLELPSCCVIVETTKVENEEELNKLYKKYLEQNYEGQMIRVDAKYENKRSKYLLKRKEFIDEEFIILDVIEGLGNLQGKIGKLKFRTNDGVEFDAPVNASWIELEKLWNDRESLIGKTATVKYFEKTSDGSLRFPKVIQIDRWDL